MNEKKNFIILDEIQSPFCFQKKEPRVLPKMFRLLFFFFFASFDNETRCYFDLMRAVVRGFFGKTLKNKFILIQKGSILHLISREDLISSNNRLEKVLEFIFQEPYFVMVINAWWC